MSRISNFINRSLANRLFISFTIIGFLPFIIFLIYTLWLSETKIVDKLILDQHRQATHVSKLINAHIEALQKEVMFLSKLDVMDDLLAEDIDKRVSRLLEQRKDDYALELDFYAMSSDFQILASSNKEMIAKKLSLESEIINNKGYFFVDKQLYIYSKLYASFEEAKHIGYFVLEYNLNNLEFYLEHSDNEYAYIKREDVFVGAKSFFNLETTGAKGVGIFKEHIVVYQKMESVLENWYIYYVLKKSIALEFFYEFIRFMLYLSPLLILLTTLMSKKLSQYIVAPIERLTEVTDEIVDSKDYSKLLYMSSSDEVGRLAHSFNVLLNTTDKTLDASEAKSAFISNMSHELKTPLNAIIGFSQYLIIYEDLTEEQLDMVSNIENSSQYLLEMIYGILDIAKIEAGKVEVNLEKLDCVQIAKDCFIMLEPLAYDKDLEFKFISDKCTLKHINTDEKIFKQILINLLSNAIKYTNKGTVNVELSSTDNNLTIKVKDTGVGIKKEEMGKLFKEFSRIENELSSEQKGTGLGLSLSKKLAHILDGDIYLQSEGENCGTTAVFFLKIKD